MAQKVVTHYLEMLSPDELRSRQCKDNTFWIKECKTKLYAYNRFLYELVGNDWHWLDKLPWTDDDWRRYAENENLRTWVGYVGATPAGYYELQKQEDDNVEIANFGLAGPFIGQRLGGYLLSCAISSAWEWGAKRVWVHTCSLDHPNALRNYLARGMKIYKAETANK